VPNREEHVSKQPLISNNRKHEKAFALPLHTRGVAREREGDFMRAPAQTSTMALIARENLFVFERTTDGRGTDFIYEPDAA
jgi:hypothetical protein